MVVYNITLVCLEYLNHGIMAINNCKYVNWGQDCLFKRVNNATLFQYLAYTICFREEEGFCKIAYATNKYSTSDPFTSDGKSGKDIAKVISKGFTLLLWAMKCQIC